MKNLPDESHRGVDIVDSYMDQCSGSDSVNLPVDAETCFVFGVHSTGVAVVAGSSVVAAAVAAVVAGSSAVVAGSSVVAAAVSVSGSAVVPAVSVSGSAVVPAVSVSGSAVGAGARNVVQPAFCEGDCIGAGLSVCAVIGRERYDCAVVSPTAVSDLVAESGNDAGPALTSL